MELFASPMACSLASHITALGGRSAGQGPLRREQEDRRRRRLLPDLGQGLRAGALRLDDGQVLNEGPSVLQYLADAASPRAGLAPAWGARRALPAHRHAELPARPSCTSASSPTSSIPTRRSRPRRRPGRCSSRRLDYLAEEAGRRRLPGGQQRSPWPMPIWSPLLNWFGLPRRSTSPSGRPSPPITPEHLRAPVRRQCWRWAMPRCAGARPAPRRAEGRSSLFKTAKRSFGAFRGPWARRCPSRCGAGWSACSS